MHFVSISQAITERGAGRIWQGDRKNGANTLTIAAGHCIDALCFVAGDFAHLSARLDTKITKWHNTDTGQDMAVDSPDWVSVSGRLEHGAEVSFLVATVPFNPSGNRFEIYGSEGTLSISGGASNIGPNKLSGSRGKEPLAPMEPPERFIMAPEVPQAGPPRNVAQAYARFAGAANAGQAYHPDFAHALKTHQLIAAIEQSAAGGSLVRLPS